MLSDASVETINEEQKFYEELYEMKSAEQIDRSRIYSERDNRFYKYAGKYKDDLIIDAKEELNLKPGYVMVIKDTGDEMYFYVLDIATDLLTLYQIPYPPHRHGYAWHYKYIRQIRCNRLMDTQPYYDLVPIQLRAFIPRWIWESE